MKISEKLVIFRKRKGYTIKEVSNMTGISTATLLNYESGKTIPTAENVVKLAIALGVKCQDLTPFEQTEQYGDGINHTKYSEEIDFIDKHKNISID